MLQFDQSETFKGFSQMTNVKGKSFFKQAKRVARFLRSPSRVLS